MARNVDLTGKLGLGEKPTITIGDTTLTVNDSAIALIRVLDIAQANMTPAQMIEAYTILFGEDGPKTLENLNVKFADFPTIIETAVELAMGGGGDDSGNAETPATI